MYVCACVCPLVRLQQLLSVSVYVGAVASVSVSLSASY